MPKQTKGAGLAKADPPNQGNKGGRGGAIKKHGPSDRGGTGEVGGSAGKRGKGAGTTSGGMSGGKLAKSPVRARGKNNPGGKGSGNR